MYGMVLQSIVAYLQQVYGDEVYKAILECTGITEVVFNTHEVYPDKYPKGIAQASSTVLEEEKDPSHYLEIFGRMFVQYCHVYGHDKILRVSGRHFRDLIRNMNHLHHCMRYSYPRMSHPSFIVVEEDVSGMVLHYESVREGFAPYVSGQLKELANSFFHKKHFEVDIVSQQPVLQRGSYLSIFRLHFVNSGYVNSMASYQRRFSPRFSEITTSTFYNILPYSMFLDKKLTIKQCGPHLQRLFPIRLVGCWLGDVFKPSQPNFDLNFDEILHLQDVVIELESLLDLVLENVVTRENILSRNKLLLKGQFKQSSKSHILFISSTPTLSDLSDLERIGFFLSDLPIHSGSADLAACGWHSHNEVFSNFQKEAEKSRQLEDSLRKLDEWKKRGDTLLSSMVPRYILEKMEKQGGLDHNGLYNYSEPFDEVTVMFVRLYDFNKTCSVIPATDILKLISLCWSTMDSVTDKYDVLKVENRGEEYMVASGIPSLNGHRRASEISTLALDILKTISTVQFPDLPGEKRLVIRTGMNSGPVMGGIVGLHLPRFCIFGDTVNTASRMESTGIPFRIQCSQSTHDLLQEDGSFKLVKRGIMTVKGKGDMQVFWLVSRVGFDFSVEIDDEDLHA